MKKYMNEIEKKESEAMIKRTLDFLISLSKLMSNSEVNNLLEEILTYITSLKGRQWKEIYETTIKRLDPIKRELDDTRQKVNNIIEIENASKRAKLCYTALNYSMITLILTFTISIVFYLVFMNYIYSLVLLEILETIIIFLEIFYLYKMYKKIDINMFIE
ncbi:hypothetical protein SUSAZ_08565 [Sulfolobus acidocaldarius SUSAZ]|nr:hypothetical protein SUSAZ_08565 [Sulfolobus acidocaldarius SUSAZ]